MLFCQLKVNFLNHLCKSHLYTLRFRSPFKMNLTRVRFVFALFFIECVIIILFVQFVSYDVDRYIPYENISRNSESEKTGRESSKHFGNRMDLESKYQDIHIMIFLGLGFLHSSLRNYGYSALGLTMIIGVIGIQWAILCQGIYHHGENWNVHLTINTLINADFATTSVLISIGAVLGVASYFELIFICIVEIFLYALNEFIILELLQVKDLGGSIYIHTFAAYYGLALSRLLRSNKNIPKTNATSSKTSDIFAVIGTLILWVYWPSFNGILAIGEDQQFRAILNTLFALCGSVVFTFITSVLVSDENKLSMMHVQNATLAGGAAIGAVADMMIKPFGAILIGSLAGVVSTLGYAFLTPFFQSKWNLHDTEGIHNLHGMTGIIGGLSGAVVAAVASENDYGKALYQQYPARAPLENSAEFLHLISDSSEINPGDNRSSLTQAVYQLAALSLTVAIAIAGGLFTGLTLKIPLFGRISKNHYFEDTYFWHTPQDYEQSQKLISLSDDDSKSSDDDLQEVLPNFNRGDESTLDLQNSISSVSQ